MAKVLDSLTLPIKKNGVVSNETIVNNPLSTAGQFSASTAYAVGQYVYYDKKLYRFTSAHAAGAWNASHVTEVTVASELADLKEDTTELKQDLSQKVNKVPANIVYTDNQANNLIRRYDLIAGEYIGSTGGIATGSNWNRTDYIDITGVSKISFGNVGQSAFYDSDKTFISLFSSTSTAYSVPSGAKYIRCSVANSNLGTAYVNKGSTVLPYDDGYIYADISYIKSMENALYDISTLTGEVIYTGVDDIGVITDVTPMPDALVVSGINIWNEQWENGTYGTSTGGYNQTTNNICSLHTSPIPIQPETTYAVICPYNMALMFYKADGTYLSYTVATPSDPTFTTPENAYQLKFYVPSNYGATYNNDLQITFASCPEKSTYHPYTGRIITKKEVIQLDRGKYYIYSKDTSTSLSITLATFKNILGKKPYESGYIHFTVPVNDYIVDDSDTSNEQIDNENSIVNVDCILSLPVTYEQIGEPTKLIMLCHGAGRGVYGNDTAYDEQGDWRQITGYNNLVSAFNNAGYAVFDCNGYANTQQGCAFWGAQRGIEAWRKAYDYVVKNYNVEENISIYGFSMGGCTALNLAFQGFPNVKCIALGSPVTTLDETTYDNAGAAFNAAYGITEYDADVLLGNNPMANVVEIDGTDYCQKTIAPLKIWFGGNETWPAPSDAQRLVTAIKNAGGKAAFRLATGRGHGISYGEVAYIVNEIVMYINRYND